MGRLHKSVISGTEKGHNHARCVSAALDEAERLCNGKGINLTDTRRRVLELVWQGHQPVKAYEIIEDFSKSGKATKPPTVYRALEFLVENGLVHRIESLNAFIGCSSPVEAHAANFFICKKCHVTVEIDSRRIDDCLDKLAAEKGFLVESRTVEVYGLCSSCAKKAKD